MTDLAGVGHTRDRPRLCHQSLPCVNANALPTLLKTVLPPNDVTALLPCFSIPKAELRVMLESDASIAHALETLAETNKPTPLRATTVFGTTYRIGNKERGPSRMDAAEIMGRDAVEDRHIGAADRGNAAILSPPMGLPLRSTRVLVSKCCWNSARSSSDGAADTAQLRRRRPCARPPSPPTRPRVAALGIRVGSTRCRPPLTRGTRPRGGSELAEYPAAAWDCQAPVASSMAAYRKVP